MIIPSVAEIVGGRALPRTGPDDSVLTACQGLDRYNVAALVVIENDALLGVVSEHDVIRKCICAKRGTGDTRVREIMSPDPLTVSPEETLATAWDRMTGAGIRHLPVVYEGRTLGLLSIRDIPTEYRLMAERFTEARVSPNFA